MTTAPAFSFRKGTPDDIPALYRLLMRSAWDLAWRIGASEEREPTAEELASGWTAWSELLEHLTATADQFWVAATPEGLAGYARSVVRDDVRELTELFIDPAFQAAGLGAELLGRAMPPGPHRRAIIATLDLRAQARYHKLGLHQVCAVYTFARAPQVAPVGGDLTFVPLTPTHLPLLDRLDQTVLGHRRSEDHAWLLRQRAGFLALRAGTPVGYGYVGHFSGPFVLVDPQDYPSVLTHAENLAAGQQLQEFAVDVPMLNRVAVQTLFDRGFKLSPFFCFYMADWEPKHVDHTIVVAPLILV